MTYKEYLSKIETQLNRDLHNELKKYIPKILTRVGKISLDKFINEGDPILELKQFQKLFEEVITQEMNKQLEKEKRMVIKEELFETIVLMDEKGELMSFKYCLN